MLSGFMWLILSEFPRVKYIVPVELKIFYYNDGKDKDDCENL